MILPKIALRNLTRQKRRSILLGSALSFGMFILVLVNGLTGGLVASLQKNFAGLLGGHVFFLQLEKSADGRLLNVITDDGAFLDALEKSGIKYSSMTRQTTAQATLIYSGEGAVRSLTGVDWNNETSFADKIDFVSGSAVGMAGTDGILISDTLAENLGLLPRKKVSYAEKALIQRDVKIRWKSEGQSFNLSKAVEKEVKKIEADREKERILLVPNLIGEELLAELPTIYGQQNVASFTIQGVFRTQMDSQMYVDRKILNEALAMDEGTYNILGLVLEDWSHLDVKTLSLYNLSKDSYNMVPLQKLFGKGVNSIIDELDKEDFIGSKSIVTNLNNELGSFVQILTAVQAGSFGLFLVIVLVVMVGLVNTFRIVVYERTKEIGTMRALGAQKSQVRSLFVLEALFLSVGGTLPGAVLGFILLNVIRLLKIDAFTELAVFLDNGHVTYTVNGGLFLASYLFVIILTLIAALMPARRAAKLDPAIALRTNY
ncbi:MAG TPA: FtsX-like permease family protein [Treponemataceae bacterium]|nr:FtsX-like permease family protein [Treponemataceae bacterium]